MWEAQFTCCSDDRVTRRCMVLQRTHPVTRQEPYPRCTKCGRIMTLARYIEVKGPEQSKQKPKRRRGGFNAQQMELF